MNVQHLGDCSIYIAGSKICDCGALRETVKENIHDADICKAWVDHHKAINNSIKVDEQGEIDYSVPLLKPVYLSEGGPK